MKSRTTRKFRERFASLPDQVRQQAREAYNQFRLDPYHNSLHFKRVHTRRPIYSARVSYDYRAIGLLEGGSIAWFWIGSHSEYDKLLKRL